MSDIINFLKNQFLCCGIKTLDYLLLVKILICENFKRCKDRSNNVKNWTILSFNVLQNNVSFNDDTLYENVASVRYYYNQKEYNIVQKFNTNDNTLLEKFPLYSDELIEKAIRSKFGKTKIMSAFYGDDDVTDIIKMNSGPLGNFYSDLVNNELNITDIKAWWVLPKMLNNKDKKLVITDQFLNDYTFGPFDTISFNTAPKENIFDDILNDINQNDTKINIDLSNIDNIINNDDNQTIKAPPGSPVLTKRTKIKNN